MNQGWHLRWVLIPDGTHLSDSKNIPGAERDILREDGTNNLLGPTESFPADEELLRFYTHGKTPQGSANPRELSPAQQLLSDAIKEGLNIVIDEVIVPALRERVAPAVKRKLNEIAKNFRSAPNVAHAQAGSTEVSATATTPQASKETEVLVEKSEIGMTSAEFRERMVAAMFAENFATEQRRILHNARIDDGNLSPELEKAIKLAIEGDVSSLDEETRVAVMRFLTGGGVVGGDYGLSGSSGLTGYV